MEKKFRDNQRLAMGTKSGKRSLNNLVKILLQAFFVIVVFVFLGRSLLFNWNRKELNLNEINYLYVAISTTFFGFAWISAAISWDYINNHLKNPLGLRAAIRIWSFSQAARYIPGSVWQVFGRIYMGEKKGLTKGKTLASIAIETSNLIISSILVFVISLPFWQSVSVMKTYLPYLAVGSLVVGFTHPKIFNFVTNFFVHRLDKEEKSVFYSFKDIVKMLLPYLLFWFLFGCGFYFLMFSFKGIVAINLPVAIGMFSLSWVIGFLFVIAPGGLGAREGALVYFLSFYFSHPVAILLAIFSRVLMIVAELFVLLFAFLLR